MRLVSKKLQVLVGALLLMMAAGANALTYTIDAVFEDGGTLTGTFDWDGTDVTIISLVATGGSFADHEYFPGDVVFSDLGGFDALTFDNGDFSLSIFTLSDLSLVEGTEVGLDTILSLENDGFDFTGTDRFFASGTVTAVPLPAAAWLFLSALGALGMVRRRRAIAA